MNKILGITVIAVAMLLTACDSKSDLTRSLAEKLLEGYLELPYFVTRDVDLDGQRSTYEGGVGHWREQYADIITKFEDAGMGTGNISVVQNGSQMQQALFLTKYTIELSEEAKQYLQGEPGVDTFRKAVRVARVATDVTKFKEVTGIAFLNDDKTLAEVEYSVVKTKTPFSKVVYPGINQEEPEIKIRSKSFRLYDDGWRIID